MAEKDFQSELNRGLRATGWWSHKIADSPTSRFSGVQGSRFTHQKPFDCLALVNGVCHALELKQVRTGLSLSLTELRDHQEEALLAVDAAGGRGWLVTNFRVRLSATQARRRGVETIDRAFAARISQVVHARVEEARTGLPLDWWEANAVELPRQRHAGVLSWDPTPIAAATPIPEAGSTSPRRLHPQELVSAPRPVDGLLEELLSELT